MLDTYIEQSETKLAQLMEPARPQPHSEGERFVVGYGRAVYTAIVNYLRQYRAEMKGNAAEAAE
jgi:hypothetical protein